jgi:hypothetical protein
MESQNIQPNESKKVQASFKKPLIVFALPFILYLPTLWLFHDFIPEHSDAPARFGGIEHMRVHWGVFWIITFFPFAAICFLSALIMFLLRLRKR